MASESSTKLDLAAHLGELRTRLIRCIIYQAAGTIVAWFCYDYLLAFLVGPMTRALPESGSFLLTSFPEAFMVQVQVSLVAGLTLAIPGISFEVWRFIRPGLAADEVRIARGLVPLAVVLFAGGVAIGFLILPAAFKWFAAYTPSGAELRPSLQDSVLFSVKMLLAFGLVFELPVVLLIAAKTGLVTSRVLLAQWRVAVLIIAIVAAVATPSGDLLSMMVMAVPVVVLYFLSIALVRMVER